MIPPKKPLIHFLFIVIVFSITFPLAEATTMSFTVHGEEDVSKSIILAVDDHVLIRFTVVGQPDNSLLFYMICPNGTTREFGKLGTFKYDFVCDVKGEYVLHFSNIDSPEDKLVTLDYEAEHYIFGIPQMLFLTIIIVIVCVAAVAAFILMGKPR